MPTGTLCHLVTNQNSGSYGLSHRRFLNKVWQLYKGQFCIRFAISRHLHVFCQSLLLIMEFLLHSVLEQNSAPSMIEASSSNKRNASTETISKRKKTDVPSPVHTRYFKLGKNKVRY